MEQEELLKIIKEQKAMMEEMKQQMAAASEQKTDDKVVELQKLKEELIALQNANKPKSGLGHTEYGASLPEEYQQGDEIGYKRSFYIGNLRSIQAKMSLQDISFVDRMK